MRYVRLSDVQLHGVLFFTAAVWAEMRKSVAYKVFFGVHYLKMVLKKYML